MKTMDPDDALRDAQAILDKRAADKEFTVLVDRPSAIKPTINAFKKLGCKVKSEKDGTRLRITRA
jgi:hypothetical protein